MAKRHASIVPLARDHHEGLILAVRLQQGKKALEKLWSHDPNYQAKYVVGFYEDHLKSHFEAEERALFPLALQHIAAARPIVEELVAEHRSMEEYVRSFSQPDLAILERRLVEFGRLLEEHIRKEDRKLFPLFEERASKAVLAEAEKQLKQFYPGT